MRRVAAISLALDERPIDELPAAPPDTYEVADDHVFAVFGSQLWAITCAP